MDMYTVVQMFLSATMSATKQDMVDGMKLIENLPIDDLTGKLLIRVGWAIHDFHFREEYFRHDTNHKAIGELLEEIHKVVAKADAERVAPVE